MTNVKASHTVCNKLFAGLTASAGRTTLARIHKLTFITATIGIVVAFTGGQALADRQARTASTTQFEAHATLNIPPEEVGLFIHIKLDGRIATTSHSRVVKSCRRSRSVRINWTRLDGTKVRGNETYPTTRTGHFGAEFDIDYEKDVPSSGGPFKFTIVSPKDHVAGKRLGTSYTCKKLTETLTVNVPPELPAP